VDSRLEDMIILDYYIALFAGIIVGGIVLMLTDHFLKGYDEQE
jgi:hypothetical protein